MFFRRRGAGLAVLLSLCFMLGCAAPVKPAAPLVGAASASSGQARTATPSVTPTSSPTFTPTVKPVARAFAMGAPALKPSPVPTAELPAAAADYWPTAAWRTSTAEDQGMSSRQLASLLDTIQSESLAVHSVTVVRHGYIVLDAYWYPYRPGLKHELESCTKSVMSALTGIAIDRGYIHGVDSRVADLLAMQLPADTDPRKSDIALKHLLTMSSGLEWSGGGDKDSTSEMEASQDWPGYVLSQQPDSDPGPTWSYNNGAVHVLSAILQKASGKTSLQLARESLFGPLGITDVGWVSDPQGTTIGFGGLRLTPRDMAKLGLLYLRGGVWDGRQIVSRSWVQSSTSLQMPSDWFTGYGYLWFMIGPGVYGAYGSGDQFIFVAPSRDLVVVFTGGMGSDTQGGLPPVRLLSDVILPAIHSDGRLPADAAGSALLADRIRAVAAQPAATAPAPQPDVAASISGKIFALDGNDMGLKSITYSFTGGSEARVTLDVGKPMS
ncbi:MAG: serine hydrolase, partial [Rudaea sp.]